MSAFALEYDHPNVWMQPVSQTDAAVTFHPDGALIQIEGGVQLPLVFRKEGSRHDGKRIQEVRRGNVKGYSPRSRQRFMEICAKLADQGEMPLFLTLTYPGLLTSRLRSRSKWKRDLNEFHKWLNFHYPKSAALWRLELKKRLSGHSAGRVAPHFHLVIWGIGFLPHLQVAAAWYNIVGSGQKDHQGAGINIERCRTRAGVMCYATKYVQKGGEELDDDGFLGGKFAGRYWGVWNKKNLVWSREDLQKLDPVETTVFRRTVRRYCQSKGIKACWRARVVNIYTRDFDTFYKLAAFIRRQSIDEPF